MYATGTRDPFCLEDNTGLFFTHPQTLPQVTYDLPTLGDIVHGYVQDEHVWPGRPRRRRPRLRIGCPPGISALWLLPCYNVYTLTTLNALHVHHTMTDCDALKPGRLALRIRRRSPRCYAYGRTALSRRDNISATPYKRSAVWGETRSGGTSRCHEDGADEGYVRGAG